MTTHELANILLQQEDVPVHFQYFDGGPDEYYNPVVSSVHEYKGRVYLSETDTLFPPDMRYGEWEDEEQDDEEETNVPEFKGHTIEDLRPMLKTLTIHVLQSWWHEDLFKMELFDFVNEFPKERFSKIRNAGKKTMANLEEALAHYGYTWL